MIYSSGLVIGLLLCSMATVTAQSVTEPLGPGALALAAGRPDASEIIRRALAAADPLTRTVAARLAGIRGDGSLAGDVAGALEKETDAFAEAEMATALLFLGGGVALNTLMPRLQRASPTTVVAVANWVAQAQPERFAARLPHLAERLGARAGRLGPAVIQAMLRRPNLAGPVLRAWLAVADPTGWSTVIRHRALELESQPQADVIRESLASTRPDIREATVWMLLFRIGAGQKLPAAILDAAMTDASTSSSAGDLTWETWGRELIARQQGRTTPDRAEFVAREAGGHTGHTQRLAALDAITPAEERALRSALGDRYADRDSLRKVVPIEYNQAGGAMRTLPLPWPGFFASLVTAAECRLSPTRRVAAIRATYLDDGRHDRVQMDPSRVPRGCEQVIEALARLLLADPEQRLVGQEGEWVLVPMDTSFLECSSHPQNPDAETVRLPGGGRTVVPTPRKVRDQVPTYPQTARWERIQGTVLLEGEVSDDGCPAAMRVVHGVHPSLDWEALIAVSAWRFSPAELNGAPVAVGVSFSVRFVLR